MGTGDSEGPAWNKFWLSMDNDTESQISEGGTSSHRPHTERHGSQLAGNELTRQALDRVDSSVLPNDSASHQGDHSPPRSQLSPPASIEHQPFPFKFKGPSGRVHRLQVKPGAGLVALITAVTEKLGNEVEAVGGEAVFEDGRLGKGGYALSYMDNEGDTVSITTDLDLLEAVNLARQSHRDKVDLFVHDPEKPAMVATVDPHPLLSKPPTPPASTTRSRKQRESTEEEDEDEELTKKERRVRQAAKSLSAAAPEQQHIPGVPNELLLPGAVVTLAVVIVGVFALTRGSNR